MAFSQILFLIVLFQGDVKYWVLVKTKELAPNLRNQARVCSCPVTFSLHWPQGTSSMTQGHNRDCFPLGLSVFLGILLCLMTDFRLWQITFRVSGVTETKPGLANLACPSGWVALKLLSWKENNSHLPPKPQRPQGLDASHCPTASHLNLPDWDKTYVLTHPTTLSSPLLFLTGIISNLNPVSQLELLQNLSYYQTQCI